MILGILLSFVTAIKDIFYKKALQDIDPRFLMNILSLSSALIVLPFVIYEGFPTLTPTFLLAFFGGGVLFYIGKFFYFKALQVGEISFIAPLRGLVTVNVIFTSWLLLGELPSVQGITGILIIALGVYLLAIQKNHVSVLAPIKHIFTDKGSRLYLITILCYGFTVTIDKIGVLETSPFFWTLSMNLFIFFATLSSVKGSYKKGILKISEYKGYFTIAIFLNVFAYVLQMYVISVLLSSYTSAYKTSSVLFTVLIGGIIFKESDLKKKFLAAIIIVIGIFLIYFS